MLLEQGIQAAGVCLLVHGPDNGFTLHAAVLEEDHRGNHGNVVLLRQIPVLVHVDFYDDRPAIVLTRDFIDPRCECLAGRSPGGEKVNQYWFIAIDECFEFRGTCMDDLVCSTQRCPGLVGPIRTPRLRATCQQCGSKENNPATVFHFVSS